MTQQAEAQDYIDRKVRRAVGVRALRKIHGMVDDMERERHQGAKAALYLVALFITALAVIAGVYALR